MKRGMHLSFATMTDLAEDRLAASERPAAQAHLTTCERCAAELRSITDLLTIMRTDRSEDAPRAVVARASELFRRRALQQEPRPSLMRRIIAAVGFDSARLQPQFGVRAALTGTRQVLFSAGEFDIDVHLHLTGANWTVAGQVLGPCTSGDVELQGASGTVRTSINQLCEFSLEPVPAGTYRLVLRMPDVELEVSSLVIGSTDESV